MNGELCVGGSICRQGKCTCPSGSTVEGRPCSNRFSRSIVSLTGRNEVHVDGNLDRTSNLQPCPLENTCLLPKCYCSRCVLKCLELTGWFESNFFNNIATNI